MARTKPMERAVFLFNRRHRQDTVARPSGRALLHSIILISIIEITPSGCELA